MIFHRHSGTQSPTLSIHLHSPAFHLGLFCSMSLIYAVLVGLPWWLHNVIFCDYTAPVLLLLLLRLPLVSQLGVVGTYGWMEGRAADVDGTTDMALSAIWHKDKWTVIFSCSVRIVLAPSHFVPSFASHHSSTNVILVVHWTPERVWVGGTLVSSRTKNLGPPFSFIYFFICIYWIAGKFQLNFLFLHQTHDCNPVKDGSTAEEEDDQQSITAQPYVLRKERTNEEWIG